jgi:iron(II)-dependent oxidoreductase
MMGSDPAVDPDADGDEMPHLVSLDAFRISKYEITNAQYAQCVRATVCDEPEGLRAYSDLDYAAHPVVYVSWSDAQGFCQWVGGRLPTEAEWEYAARGEEEEIHPWGDEPATCERAQYDGCEGDTVPVGSFGEAGASWRGVEDMAGNVWEWVWDWWGYYPSEPQMNPTGPEDDTGWKVARGGSFTVGPNFLRGANRNKYPVFTRNYSLGFRCAAAGPGQ